MMATENVWKVNRDATTFESRTLAHALMNAAEYITRAGQFGVMDIGFQKDVEPTFTRYRVTVYEAVSVEHEDDPLAALSRHLLNDATTAQDGAGRTEGAAHE